MASARMDLKGRTAVVTGAAGGIGRGIALALARRGARLALADINLDALQATAAEMTALGASVSHHRLDVADGAAIAAFPSQVLAWHPGADLLFNNAGVALGGQFEAVSEADFDWLFSINFFGVVRLTRAFLPHLRRSDDARLVNLSSLFGLIAPPGQVAYAASKFAVRGFSNALAAELAGSSVGVTVVHPGGVATRIAADARMSGELTAEQKAAGTRAIQKFLKMPPQTAGEIIVSAVERRRARVLVGSDAKIASMIERLAPVSYWKIMQGLSGRKA